MMTQKQEQHNIVQALHIFYNLLKHALFSLSSVFKHA